MFLKKLGICVLNYYGLDPAYCINLPNYSWNVFLSLTGVRLQQIHINEMYEMIEHEWIKRRNDTVLHEESRSKRIKIMI